MLPTRFRPVQLPAAKPRPSALQRARERFAADKLARRRGTRIGFIVDATGSRAQRWEEAQTIQSRMFRGIAGLKGLRLRLVHFGDNRLDDLDWQDNARTIARHMAAVRCVSGLTMFIPALSRFADAQVDERAHSIILIGDSFEEDAETAFALARKLKSQGIRVFSFHEGDDETAQDTLRQLAVITGGKAARFGDELPLADLCEGVALLTAGGSKAVKKLANPNVQRLLLEGPKSP